MPVKNLDGDLNPQKVDSKSKRRERVYKRTAKVQYDFLRKGATYPSARGAGYRRICWRSGRRLARRFIRRNRSRVPQEGKQGSGWMAYFSAAGKK